MTAVAFTFGVDDPRGTIRKRTSEADERSIALPSGFSRFAVRERSRSPFVMVRTISRIALSHLSQFYRIRVPSPERSDRSRHEGERLGQLGADDGDLARLGRDEAHCELLELPE